MRQFSSRLHRSHRVRGFAAAVLLLSAGCGEGTPTVSGQPRQPPVAPGTPQADAGIAGISNAGSTVCARDGAGATWCTRADTAGAFRITRAEVEPGTGTGLLPVQGELVVFNVDCGASGKTVDRSGPQRNGGDWLDVRCTLAGCVAPPSGLLAWYRFDEALGDTVADHADAAPRSTLRLHGPAAHVPGRVLRAVQFTTRTAYASGGADKNVGTGDFSIALWIRNGPDGAFSTLLDKRDSNPLRGYHMILYNGEPLIQLADAGENGSSYNYHAGFRVAWDEQWHHLVVTVERASPSGVRWYYDGLPAGVVGDPTGRQGSLSSARALTVGWGSGYMGSVDELQIVNRVLAPAEIATLYARPSCR